MTTTEPSPPLPLSVRIGWASGSIVTSTLVFVTTTFFLRFMTDFVGIGAAVAGGLLASTKIFDALINPLMGLFSDRSRGEGGRRRRYLLIGAGIGAIAMLGMFNLPVGLQAGTATTVALVMLMLSSVGYTAFNVSYLSMPAEMTTSSVERAGLISFRIYALAIAQFIAGGLAPLVLMAFGGGRSAYGAMAVALAALIMSTAMIAFISTRKAPFTQLTAQMRSRFWAALPTLFRSRLYVTLLLLKATFLIGSTAHTATAAYYVHHVMRASDATLSLFLTVYSAGMVLSQMLWLWLIKRIGRVRCFIVAAGAYTIASIAWAMMGAHLPAGLFFVLSTVNGMGAGGILLVSESMLPEAIEEDYRLSGIHREGTLASLFAFAEKFAHAAGLALVGALLAWYGYVAPKTGGILNGDGLRAVMAAFGLLPATFVGGSCLWLLLLKRTRPAHLVA
ncbi:glycoside/pentoside/hexuronide:cation symporter, GPH family [Sphingomonas sp. YR710]|uniref:MFS transporter n=1 Tax=Sphingomonas sp. YR710 TaxID=1882773 RepID=UPI000880220D|nr:MFS transporter [Sphingomonas sp. YR710]SDC82637.1 glycoside/pentoside/hexuronide:cation symporter, GPH family [Sphingomonas sp. YR710]